MWFEDVLTLVAEQLERWEELLADGAGGLAAAPCAVVRSGRRVMAELCGEHEIVRAGGQACILPTEPQQASQHQLPSNFLCSHSISGAPSPPSKFLEMEFRVQDACSLLQAAFNAASKAPGLVVAAFAAVLLAWILIRKMMEPWVPSINVEPITGRSRPLAALWLRAYAACVLQTAHLLCDHCDRVGSDRPGCCHLNLRLAAPLPPMGAGKALGSSLQHLSAACPYE